MNDLVNLLVTLLIMGVVFWAINLVITTLIPLPANIVRVVQVVIAVIFVIYLIKILMGVGGVHLAL